MKQTQLIALRCNDDQLRRLDEISDALGFGGNRSATIRHLIIAAAVDVKFTPNKNTQSAQTLAGRAMGVGA